METLFIASVLAFASAFSGGLLVLRGNRFSGEGLKLTNGFSAGLLIVIALAHMLPESRLEDNYIFAVLGFGIFYLIQGFTRTASCGDISCGEPHPSGGLITWLGMSFHALVDGIAMGVGFSASQELGYLIAFAILIHKAPIGFSLSSILLSRRYSRKDTLLLLLAFSLITPIGALLSGYATIVKASMIHSALAFSGGTFLHICVSELLPEAHAERNRTILYYVLGGILIGLLPKLFE